MNYSVTVKTEKRTFSYKTSIQPVRDGDGLYIYNNEEGTLLFNWNNILSYSVRPIDEHIEVVGGQIEEKSENLFEDGKILGEEIAETKDDVDEVIEELFGGESND